jgi:hypothetical protein
MAALLRSSLSASVGFGGGVQLPAVLAGQTQEVPGLGLHGMGRVAQNAGGVSQLHHRVGELARLNILLALPQLAGARRPAGRHERSHSGDDNEVVWKRRRFFVVIIAEGGSIRR